ncbi:MAG TPA: hypothetical protein VK494_02570 [Gemmatimonadaceae bacterium]|nr:hypothetical protein [Gemmatimonadaceae bacterium]
MRTHLSLCGAALMLGVAAKGVECQRPAADSVRALRESLRTADAAASAAAFKRGLAEALPLEMTDDAVLLWEAAPIVWGRANIAQLLAAHSGVRVTWTPFRVLVSADGQLGVTFGETSRYVDARALVTVARYITVWRRVAPNGWKIAALAPIGLVSPDSVKVPTPAPRAAVARAVPADPFALADLAFARMARDSVAPAAFEHFSAPDAMTLASSGELNIGPATIRARLSESRAGGASWKWRPVATIAAASGDLGATVGEAEIRSPGDGVAGVFFSKYITIWQRQPDGSLRFVVDGGNSRPKP